MIQNKTEKEKAPWLTGVSIFTYVKNNIGPDGCFAVDELPDRSDDGPAAQMGAELGSEDGYVSVFADGEQEPLAQKMYDLIQTYSKDPSKENALALYYEVCASECILYHEILLDKLAQDKVAKPMIDFALELLYHAPEREAVKFAVLICGLVLLNLGNPALAKKLHGDLLLLARCEEFTVHVIFACELNHELSQADFWDILIHTKGWGRLYAMESYEFNTKEKRDWLLSYGSDITVIYPAVALIVMKEGHLQEALARPLLNIDLTIGILRTITYYMIMLFDANPEKPDEEDIFPVLDLADVLTKLLKYAEKYCQKLPMAYWLYRLTELLDVIADNHKWDIIGANKCHLLLSTTEKLLFSKDWHKDVKENLLNKNGKVNYLVIDFALDMGLDINDDLLKLLKADPQRTGLYSVLLQAQDEEVFNTALSLAKKNLDKYTKDAKCLNPILSALSTRPGVGREFIVAGLTSLYDVTRAAAINALEKWPNRSITPKMRLGLIKGKELCQNPYLSFRIDAILNNKRLSINDFLDDIMHENE